MREILFRGKRLYDDGAWVYGSLMRWTDGDCDILSENQENEYAADKYAVDPATVGQFTTIADKNGVRIFEGDIVEAHGMLYEVSWYGYGLWLVGVDFKSLRYDIESWAIDGRVLGNIYDNPELLEAKT